MRCPPPPSALRASHATLNLCLNLPVEQQSLAERITPLWSSQSALYPSLTTLN